MEHNLLNPFVPRASIIRFPNGIFEMRFHLHGVASALEVVPHDSFVLVRGRLAPRARRDLLGNVSAVVWSDQPCGIFSRDIPLRLNPGTQIQILEHRQDCDDYVVRYTLRNAALPIRTCGAQFDAYSQIPYNHGPYGAASSYGAAGYGRATPCGKGAACACGPTGLAGTSVFPPGVGFGPGVGPAFSVGINYNSHDGVRVADTAPTVNAVPVQSAEGFAAVQQNI